MNRENDFTWHSAGMAIDEAIHLLALRGLAVEEQEAADLLETSGAVSLAREGRIHLRPAWVRRALSALPAAFNLYDRRGRKVATLGPSGTPAGALHATLPGWGTAAVADLPAQAADHARLPGFDMLGSLPAGDDLPAPLDELYSLYMSLRATPRPQLMRPRHAETLAGLRELLSALRGSVAAAEERPLVILEAGARHVPGWDRLACRLIIDAARQAIPVAIIPRMPDPGGPVERAAAEFVAGGIAAVLIHQRARQGAPLLWGVSRSAGTAWRLGMAAGTRLALPLHATTDPGEPGTPAAELWAVQAALGRAGAIVWGGLNEAGAPPETELLTRHGASVADIRRSVAAAAGIAPPVRRAHPPTELDPQAERRLTEAVAREAARLGVGELPHVAWASS